MNTNMTDAETKVMNKLNHALWVACGKHIAIAASWRLSAHAAIAKQVKLADFVSFCLAGDAHKAKAAYMLAAWEVTQ